MNHPIIAITTGEPAGIGPDIALYAALRLTHRSLVLIGDRDLLKERAAQLRLAVTLDEFQENESHQAGRVTICHVPLTKPCVAGQLDESNAAYVLRLLDTALAGCMANQFAALITCPVHKALMNQAGITFYGHTEYFANQLHVRHPVMMFVALRLRIALATTHIPLRQVPDAITFDQLEAMIKVLHHDLIHIFHLSTPHIFIAGLNPHAGESGLLGQEEIQVIEPVVHKLRQQGMFLEGPFPADTIYQQAKLAKADAILMMFHDQGLPILKSLYFGQSVNITLGLPIIRASVDHGTALDLAGTGNAKPESLLSAIRLVHQLIH